MLSDYIYDWLENALDFGISERDFWEMTLAELERAINSKRRVERLKAQERASFDYILADLIGRSIARTHSSANKMPEISEVYSSLFNSEEMKQKKEEQKAKLSALRFRQFANAYNDKFKKEAANVNE